MRRRRGVPRGVGHSCRKAKLIRHRTPAGSAAAATRPTPLHDASCGFPEKCQNVDRMRRSVTAATRSRAPPLAWPARAKRRPTLSFASGGKPSGAQPAAAAGTARGGVRAVTHRVCWGARLLHCRRRRRRLGAGWIATRAASRRAPAAAGDGADRILGLGRRAPPPASPPANVVAPRGGARRTRIAPVCASAAAPTLWRRQMRL